ncbi:MAG: sugar nucleotide-binding protein [Oceanicoccus sp.]
MKVQVIALEGQVRDALEAQLTTRGRYVVTSGGDSTHMPGVNDWNIPEDVDIVVNALTLGCLEQGVDEAYLDAMVSLAEACERAGVPIIQLSTGQVFDGGNSRRFKETDIVVPVSRIGAMLSRMEELLRGSCRHHIILRTGPLFSSADGNLLTNLITRFRRGDSISLSSLDNSCPLHAKDLARVISAIIDQLSCGCESWGTFHYCSSDPASSYQFAETALAVVSQYTESGPRPLTLKSSDDPHTEWSRPVLNCDKILNTFGIKQLPWRAFVVPTIKKIFDNDSLSGNEDAS